MKKAGKLRDFIQNNTIGNKVARLVLTISLASILLLGAASALGMINIRMTATDSLQTLNERAGADAVSALRSQIQDELLQLAKNKGDVADTSLELILNQTRLVAMAAEDIFSDPQRYLAGYDGSLPLDVFDFTCNYPAERLDTFSYHIRAPRDVMAPGSIVEEQGQVVKARLDPGRLTSRQKQELYLATSLLPALGGIRNFDNGNGTYNGIGATYFCFESSGIDVLADTLTTPMVEYDARESVWYQQAAKLQAGQVYWTDPVQDGSGRGVSLICAMPVYAEGRLIGVAGSGGLIDNIRELVQSTNIGANGYAFLLNRGGEAMTVIANARRSQESEINKYAANLLESDNQELLEALEQIRAGQAGIRELTLDGEEVYMAFSPLSTTQWSMVTVIGLEDEAIMAPISQLEENINQLTDQTNGEMNGKIMLLLVLFAGIAGGIVALVFYSTRKFSSQLVEPIHRLTEGVGQISRGDLDFQIHVDSDDETQMLGEAFNRMTGSLKEYIANLSAVTAEKERIGAELNVATQIQASMLPCIFPAFPDRKEFDIYASMTPAKEVGGDFYDFFLVDEDHLALVIADVSGKGVPAALFMVIAKTLLKNQAQMGKSPKEVMEKVNNQLCENNEAEMFVTVWMGIYEISTGKLTAANAGHEYPAVKRAGGGFELFKDRHGFVMAGMENAKYREYELQLEKGDVLFVYTDGVAEATDGDNRLYGTERMLKALNRLKEDAPQALLQGLKADIDAFVGQAPQFDDITMLALKVK